jgi:hypothetical protein
MLFVRYLDFYYTSPLLPHPGIQIFSFAPMMLSLRFYFDKLTKSLARIASASTDISWGTWVTTGHLI